MDFSFPPRRSSVFWLAIIGLLAFSAPRLGAQQSSAVPADIILHNGKILTVDPQFSTVQAVAIQGDKIEAVGGNQDILAMAGPNTLKIDLKGRTVIPGLIDTHIHLHNYAESVYGTKLTPQELHRYLVDWRGVRSKADVLNQIKGLMDKYKFKPGQWIYFVNQLSFTGGGGDPAMAKILYDDITRWDLDAITPDNPIALSLGIPDFNGFLLNSKAIDIVWNKMGYADSIKKYGRFWIDQGGRPDGHVEPPASRVVNQFTLDRDPAVMAPVMKMYNDELAASGLTTVSTRLPQEMVKTYQLLIDQGKMTLRLSYGREEVFGTLKTPLSDLKKYEGVVGSGTDMLWVTSIAPTAVDGASTRACTNQKRISAYGAIDSWWPLGQCETDDEFNGAARRAAKIPGNYFKDWIMAEGARGVRFANTHVAGDRSVANILDMIEKIQQQYGAQATRGWAFDHCFMVNVKDLPQAARLGVTFSCAPKYIQSGASVAAAYGDKVANTFIDPVKSMLDNKVNVVFETDRDIYEWYDFGLLFTRKDRKGKVWGAHEKVDRASALKMATSWAADYVLKPDKLGSLEPGKLADMVVLDKDYMTIPDDEVQNIRPQLTLLGGKIIFVNPSFSTEYNLKPTGAIIESYDDLVKRRPVSERPDF